MIIQAVIYGVWKERNVRLYHALPTPVNIIVKDIQHTIRRKLSTIDTKEGPDRSPSSDLTFLSTWFGYFQAPTTSTTTPQINPVP